MRERNWSGLPRIAWAGSWSPRGAIFGVLKLVVYIPDGYILYFIQVVLKSFSIFNNLIFKRVVASSWLK